MKPFTVGSIPALSFGAGSFGHLTDSLGSNPGRGIAIVTGARSFHAGSAWADVQNATNRWGTVTDFALGGEPSPEFIDKAAEILRSEPPECVVAIGGGSAIDAGKAIAAMVRSTGSVVEYLEGVGDKKPDGNTVPVIAVPTTSGTGSEATKNAVISRVGEGGFKKSLRHDNYIPSKVYLDPQLIVGCPHQVTAFSGLDAITQLLEAYVSTGAGNVTDQFAIEGLRLAGKSFPRLARGEEGVELRADMALAAYYSGIALANAGLGVVHGLASPLGAKYPAPHGAVCGTLVAAATDIIIRRLEVADESGEEDALYGLEKYAAAAVAVTGVDKGTSRANREHLVQVLNHWIEESKVPPLSTYGMSRDDVPAIAETGGLKNTPVALDKGDVEEILERRL